MARHCSASMLIRSSTCFLLYMNYFSFVCSGNELKKCTKIDQCRCLTDQGEINLWSLAERSGKPRLEVHAVMYSSVNQKMLWISHAFVLQIFDHLQKPVKTPFGFVVSDSLAFLVLTLVFQTPLLGTRVCLGHSKTPVQI